MKETKRRVRGEKTVYNNLFTGIYAGGMNKKMSRDTKRLVIARAN